MLAVFLGAPSLQAGLSRPVVSYDLRALLRPETKTVEGRETLPWLKIAFQAGQMEFYFAETGTVGRIVGESASPALSEAAQGSGRKHEEGLDQIQPGVDGDAQQPERQEKEPDHGVEEKGQKGEGPAENKQDQP